MQGPGTEKQARISFILVLCIFALLLATTFVGCTKEVDVPFKKPILSLTIDPMLPKDANGYFHYKLWNRTLGGNNSHEIGGIVLWDGQVAPRGEMMAVTWESSHYGLLAKGSTMITSKISYINTYTGQWTITNLPPAIAQQNYIMPTISAGCYVDRDNGQIHGVIEPTYDMRGDTMTIRAKIVHYFVTKKNGDFEAGWLKDSIIDTKKIILE